MKTELRNYNFIYCNGTDYDYDSEYDCDSYGCDSICRCRRIYNARLESIPDLEDFVISNYKGSDLDLYCIERIYAINGFYDKYNWEVTHGGGYYGEEIYGVMFNNCSKAFDEIQKLLELSDNTQKIEYVLNLEYGYKLDSILNKKWTLKEIPFADIVFGAEDHYYKLNKKMVDRYAFRKLLAKGVVTKHEDKYRVIDGYHRLSTGNKNENVTVIVGE